MLVVQGELTKFAIYNQQRYGDSMSTIKAGRRTGRTAARAGTHRDGSSEGTKRKRAAAEAAAVTEHERQRRELSCSRAK